MTVQGEHETGEAEVKEKPDDEQRGSGPLSPPMKRTVVQVPMHAAAPAVGQAPRGDVAADGVHVAADGVLVLVHYTGTLESGETFDTSRGREPLEFTLGAHTVIPGFEQAVLGMRKGERKSFTLEPEQAYGVQNQELRQEIPRQALGDIEPEVGMVLALKHPMAAQPIPVRVVAVTDATVTLDLNHPLAGERLHFDIEVVDLK